MQPRTNDINPHSQGPIFPAIIGRVEHYDDCHAYAVKCDGVDYSLARRLKYIEWSLTYPGMAVEHFDSYDEAHEAAVFYCARKTAQAKLKEAA